MSLWNNPISMFPGRPACSHWTWSQHDTFQAYWGLCTGIIISGGECQNVIYSKNCLLCTYRLHILLYINTQFLSNTTLKTPVPLGAVPYPQHPRWVSAWPIKTFILKPALGLAARSKDVILNSFLPLILVNIAFCSKYYELFLIFPYGYKFKL